MITVAQQRVSCSLLVTDASSLALRTETFDVAILAFAIFHIPDPAMALREIWRVLRPSGVMGLITWGNDPGTPGAAIWAEELDACGAAADPRDAAVMRQAQMNSPEKLANLLREADFAPPRIWSESLEHRWTHDALLALQISCGMPARRLATLSRKAQAVCRERVRSRVARLTADDLVYRAQVLFAVAGRRD
jgi:SAM-dependent methyltransferase